MGDTCSWINNKRNVLSVATTLIYENTYLLTWKVLPVFIPFHLFASTRDPDSGNINSCSIFLLLLSGRSLRWRPLDFGPLPASLPSLFWSPFPTSLAARLLPLFLFVPLVSCLPTFLSKRLRKFFRPRIEPNNRTFSRRFEHLRQPFLFLPEAGTTWHGRDPLVAWSLWKEEEKPGIRPPRLRVDNPTRLLFALTVGKNRGRGIGSSWCRLGWGNLVRSTEKWDVSWVLSSDLRSRSTEPNIRQVFL